ncbi:ribonuclease P protein component [Alkalibacterium sp. 20]|uniref:ribonuclease P protein component n=1 Tax=Alkalibacterium sp. 20 TaxID=1798803 RepID=UPI0008FFE512|nr:ribonuclease P protein component [Alkalibacterium sp. 20]OJF97187.1 ribonuclease P protein component [Alkalibacterium sp. 20]
MKKAYRVKSEADFQKVFHQGQSMANRQFVIYHLPKEGQTHFRVGISVGKKLGNAPKRNAIKRKIRHCFIEFDQEDKIKPDLDFIVIARQPVSTMDFHEIKKSLLHVLNRSNMLKSDK